MSRGRFIVLSDAKLRSVHEASLTILRDTGVFVQHPEVVPMLVSAGARIESARPIVHLPETLVMDSIARAGKTYVLHGRDAQRTARFGAGELMLMSSPGQHAWFDAQTDQLRPGSASTSGPAGATPRWQSTNSGSLAVASQKPQSPNWPRRRRKMFDNRAGHRNASG